MSRARFAFASLAALVLMVPAPASASPMPSLESCDDPSGQAPGRETAACLYRLATGEKSLREAAARRLQQLAAKHPESPWFSLYLAKVKWQTREPEEVKEAETAYRRAAELAAAKGMAEAEFEALWGICRILRDQGNLTEAAAGVERARRVARLSKVRLLELRADVLQSLQWYAEGEFEQAYQIVHGIERAVETEGSDLLTAQHLSALAKAAQETGRFHETRLAYRRSAEEAARAGDRLAEARARYGLAAVSLHELIEVPSGSGRERTLELAASALAAARSAKQPEMEAQPLWMLGFLKADDARANLERCFDVAATLWQKSFCRSALAQLAAATDPVLAEAAVHEALALAQKSGDVQARTVSWISRMRVSWTLGPRERALADARAALDAIEAVRDQQGGSAGQPGLFSTWADQYYWLSGHLLEGGDLERAFGVVERMRSRTLIDSLGLPQIAQANPALLQAGFASLEQVRETLADDEALLSFQIAPWEDLAGDFGGGAWLLVSTRGATPRVYRLPGRTELRPKVTAFIGMFEARNGSESRGASVLYEKLLAPALAELPPGVRRLAIVPDDHLHRIPFAALRPKPDEAPLATRYEITLAPSATLWLHWRKAQPALAITRALVLADPVTLATPAALTPARLGPLRYARIEGKSVMRHLDDSDLLLGEDASEAYVKKNVPFGLVHFAAHAVTDMVNPDRSGIYLSPGDSKEDGVLRVREIAEQLDLDGRIVVLSTCESASGGILRGEGVMGLARAFFQAGAHTVVASLWKLRDDDGAALFDRFYRHLGKGKSVAAALQAAQLDRMKDGAPAEAWAGVVVLGDGDRIPVPGGRGRLPWIPGLLALALLAYAARRFRQRRTTTA